MAVKETAVVSYFNQKALLAEAGRFLPTASAGAQRLLDQAKALTITTPAEWAEAADFLNRIKKLVDEIEERRTSVSSLINAGLKMYNAMFNPSKVICNEANTIVSAKVVAFKRKMDEEARKRQAELDAKAAREQEALRKAAEKKAIKLEERGLADQAEELRANVPVVEAPVVTPNLPEVAMSFRTDWEYTVVDSALIPDEYWMLNEKMLAKVVKAQGKECKIPGIKVIEKQIPVRQGARGVADEQF